MDFEASVKAIRKTYNIVSGKSDADVMLIYKGTEYGVTEPWVIKIDSREAKADNHIKAAQLLLASLKEELQGKIAAAEQQVTSLKKAMSTLGN